MPKVKGNGLHFIRTVLLKKEKTNEFQKLLTHEESEVLFKKIIANWIDMKIAVPIYEKAISCFYQGVDNAAANFGYDMALSQFNGMYRFLLKLATLDYLISISSKIWSIYIDTGKIEIQKDKSKLTFILREFPEIPDTLLEISVGFIAALMSLTNVRNVKVARENSNPQAWKFNVTWN